MKALSLSLVTIVLCVAQVSAHARDTQHLLPIADAMQIKDKDGVLDGSVKFYFAGQKHPVVLQKLTTDISNQKTNAFGKSDEEACKWVFLSTLVQFQKKAQQLGGNAVVNLVSYYKKNELADSEKFECHAGAVMAGVALKGDIVKIGDK